MSNYVTKSKSKRIPKVLPILPMTETVLFPKMVFPITIDSDTDELIKAIKGKSVEERIIGLLQPKGEEFCDVGTVVLIVDAQKLPNKNVKLTLQGLKRFKINSLIENEQYLKGNIVLVRELEKQTAKTKALVPTAIRLFSELATISPAIPREFGSMVQAIKMPSQVADMIVSSINISNEEKQEFLEIRNVKKRLEKLIHLLAYQIEELKIGVGIAKQAKESMNKNQKDFYLRQQLKAIKKELGEDEDDISNEAEEYREKLDAKNLPEAASKEAERELKRLGRLHPSAAERSVITTYLDWLIDLPWDDSTEDSLDVEKAEKILDEDHYGLKKAKKRIVEYLAVRKLKNDSQGPILCFVGPPGTGKTSIGKSIARALNREFIRISLGGVRDEAEIRGHRRTYVGALPGRIIQGIKRAGSNNPVFMLDEIDKLGRDFRGDPSSALLEALDPEQNFSFSDHYLEVPFDLSKIMFITTANTLSTIPPALKDRMEVIKFPGYTTYEKGKIAKQFLIPKQRKAHGLKGKNIKFSNAVIDKIIHDYTYEAGVRNLERELASACRGVAAKVAVDVSIFKSITIHNIRKFLGNEKVSPPIKVRDMVPGLSTVLYVSDHGGMINFIEAVRFDAPDEVDEPFILTGSLGEVMRESALIALNYIYSDSEMKAQIPEDIKKSVIHIHAPEGATGKDGPSAGLALFTALLSLFTDKPMKKDVTMTGELTLKGDILPVGGIKDKILASHRAGMRSVILPKWNKRDLDDIPEEIKKDIKFHFISNALEVLKIVFD